MYCLICNPISCMLTELNKQTNKQINKQTSFNFLVLTCILKEYQPYRLRNGVMAINTSLLVFLLFDDIFFLFISII